MHPQSFQHPDNSHQERKEELEDKTFNQVDNIVAKDNYTTEYLVPYVIHVHIQPKQTLTPLYIFSNMKGTFCTN